MISSTLRSSNWNKPHCSQMGSFANAFQHPCMVFVLGCFGKHFRFGSFSPSIKLLTRARTAVVSKCYRMESKVACKHEKGHSTVASSNFAIWAKHNIIVTPPKNADQNIDYIDPSEKHLNASMRCFAPLGSHLLSGPSDTKKRFVKSRSATSAGCSSWFVSE